jgi:hypothetical protein
MTTLFDFYKQIKGFVEGHRMIEKFNIIGSIEEVDTINVDARSLFISIESSNISHRNNTNTVTFALFVVDKCLSDDQDSLVISTQENIFVVGQVQDFILSLDNDVEFDEINMAQSPSGDYNLTAAICTFSVDFDKNIACTDYSLNSTYVQNQQSLFFETESGGIGTFYIATPGIIYVMQEEETGNFSASIINATIGLDLLVEISSTNNEVHIIETPVSGSTTVVINQDIDQYFNASGTLSVRLWQQDATGNKYVETIDPVTYESGTFNFIK